jgi:hypothetical protein
MSNKVINSVVFASIYRFSLIFILDIDDIPCTPSPPPYFPVPERAKLIKRLKQTGTLADAQTWCVVETCAGIISACLPTVIPTLKPLLGHVLGVSFSTNDMSRSKKSNTTNTNNGQSHVLEAGSRVQRSENRDRDRDRDEDMYPLKDISGTGTGTRGSRGSLSSMSGMGAGMGMKGKGQGWTVIEASGDSD